VPALQQSTAAAPARAVTAAIRFVAPSVHYDVPVPHSVMAVAFVWCLSLIGAGPSSVASSQFRTSNDRLFHFVIALGRFVAYGRQHR
jgi:hypothetical protein